MLDVKFKLEEGHDDSGDWMAPSPLRLVFWNVTHACDFRCPVCFSGSGNTDSSELTTEEARTFLRKARAAGVREIILSGGEPFLRPDMVELLVFMKELGLGARAASNGSRLTDKLLGHLRRETSLRSFMINLDSIDPEVYAVTHGTSPRSLNEVIDTIRRIRAHGYHTTVAVRLMPMTLPGLPALLEFAAREHWHTVTVMIPIHVGRVASEWLWPADKDLMFELGHVFEHFVTLPSHWRIELYVPWAPYHPVIKRLESRVPFAFVGCRAGRSSLVVQPSGRVVPCLCLDNDAAVVGHVLRDDLAAMIRDSPVCQLLREPRRHGVCDWCEFVDRCGGGCRSMAMSITGRIDAPDPTCPLVRARRPLAGTPSHAE
ncbi:MAG: radical SAM protein [Kiritimatiellae bacterium]|nr:radical SAM protein [Kiritimatiellia bacterium]